MKIAFATFNFFDYEHIHPVPKGVPEYMDTVYLTDAERNKDLALKAGWQNVFVIKNFISVEDNFGKRKAIGAIKAYPEVYAGELQGYDKLFFCDPNTRRMDSMYQDYVESADDKYTLYTTSGFWENQPDNLKFGLAISVAQPRWKYNAEAMTKAVNRYIKDLSEWGLKSPPLVSTRFIGWNMARKKTNDVEKELYDESQYHLQAELTLTYLSAKYPDDIFVYNKLKYDGENIGHKINHY